MIANARALMTPAVLCLSASHAVAQTPFRAEGRVRSPGGAPVMGAIIVADSSRTETDSLGKFSIGLRFSDSTTVSIRRLGFHSVTFTMPTDSLALHHLDIELEPVARDLDEVTVAEARTVHVPTLERFEERRAQLHGLGFFLTRADIRKRDGMPLTSLLSQARGVVIQQAGGGRAVLRMARSTQRLRPCAPHLWIDGARVTGVEIDDVPSRDVEAVELYPSAASAPSEFSAAAALGCGVVAIWTRRPILKTR